MEGGIVRKKSAGEMRGKPKGRPVDPQALADLVSWIHATTAAPAAH